jgi:formylglycine-generating enzyme required for sulfatase activity
MGMLKNIEELIHIIPKDAKIIPGHYKLSDLDDLKSTQEMLQETIGLVMGKKLEGKSLENIKKEGFASRYDSWGTAYTNAEAWIENIYSGLEKKIPEKVAKVQKIANRIYKNKKGFWEAEFNDGHVMVYIPAGEFNMGSEEGLSNEKPVHKVYLDDYWLGKYPITVGQFRKFIEETGYVSDAEKGKGSWQFWEGEWIVRLDGNWKNPYFEQGEDHPVVSVSWNDAMAYCHWLSKKTGLDFKLPTAAQWEKGARGMDGRKFPWGNQKPDGTKANYADINYWNKYKNARQPDKNINDGYTETSPVGSYPGGSSPYGLLDMAGNVWEWCHDVYQADYYTASPYKNPLGPPDTDEADQERINRGGGSWTDRSGFFTPKGGHNLRSSARTGDEQNSSDDHMGFRICMDYIKR